MRLSKRILFFGFDDKENMSMQDLGFHLGDLDIPHEEIRKLKNQKLKKKIVRLADLYTLQSKIDIGHVHKIMKKNDAPYKIKSNNSPFRSDAKLPQVVKFQDKMYIIDGNHRLAASKLAGHTTAEVLFFEIPS